MYDHTKDIRIAELEAQVDQLRGERAAQDAHLREQWEIVARLEGAAEKRIAFLEEHAYCDGLKIEELKAAINAAPHAHDCSAFDPHRRRAEGFEPCDCWKREALCSTPAP